MAICAAALAPSLGLALGMLVLVGCGQIAFLATCNSLIQLRADPSMRGRVMGVYTITLLGSTPIGGPIVGLVSQSFGPRWGLGIGGIATVLAVCVFGTAFVRARRASRAADYTKRVLGTSPMAPARSSAIAGTGSGSPKSAASL